MKKEFNQNDVVLTPTEIAKKIIEFFKPQGLILDPCFGDGAFYNNYPTKNKDWCEIRKNKDFFNYQTKVNWIISNPPFSTYDAFLKHSFEIADNVVYIIPLYKTFKSKKQQKMVSDFGGLKNVLIIGSGSELNFNMGFLCGCVHYEKGYKGLVKISELNQVTPPVQE